MTNPKLVKLFEDYGSSHQHPTNQLTHKIAIPMIVFHVLAMLSWIHLVRVPDTAFTLTVGHLAYLGAVIWYLAMDLKLGIILAVLMGLLFPLAAITPWPVVVAIAVVGWLVQLAGHSVWEKKRPSFLTNMIHALVGPMFFVAKLVGDWPLRTAPAAHPAPSTPAR